MEVTKIYPLYMFYYDVVELNKLIIDIKILDILYLDQTRVSSTKDSSVTLESKKV